MGRNKGLSRDEVVKSLKRQLTEYDIDDIPTDAIRHLQMARIICECNYVFLDDVIETLANWLKMDTGEIPKGAISLLQDALDACRGTAPHKRRKAKQKRFRYAVGSVRRVPVPWRCYRIARRMV